MEIHRPPVLVLVLIAGLAWPVAPSQAGLVSRGAADFNDDGTDEIGVFRKGMWFLSHSPDYDGVDQTTAFGSATLGTDAPDVGEFNCIPAGGGAPDANSDLVLLRRPYSTWQVTLSPDWGGAPDLSVSFGTTNHKRIATRWLDVNGDGCSDIGVFRNGCFDILGSPGYGAISTHVCFGLGTDQPLAADLNADGLGDLILWRAWSSHYTYRLSPDYATDSGADLGAGELALLGDLNGDGRTDLGSYKSQYSTFRFTTSPDWTGVDLVKTHGVSGDVPILADVNGDATSDIGIFRDSVARWWLLCSPAWGATCVSQSFGAAGDIPVYGKPLTGPPRIFYTDLVSGPDQGGEGNAGAFVTIRGKDFGATRGLSTVTIGGGAVAAYRAWSDGEIIVQIGSAAQTGNVVVQTWQGTSNGVPFTVRSGNLYFVSTSGDDLASGSFATPWRTLTKARDSMAAGDVAYAMNGVSQTVEDGTGWRAALHLSTGGGVGSPITLAAYPGATVTIGDAADPDYGIRVSQGPGHWVISGLVLRGRESAISVTSSDWRIAGNDISCPNGDGQSGCAEASRASEIAFLGNEVHDVGSQSVPQPSKQYHAVYFTTDVNHVEVGWNHIHDNLSCRAIQFHSSPLCIPSCGPSDTTGYNQYDLSVHDNRIHGDVCDGINFATVDPSQGPIRAFNNVIYDVGRGPDPPDGGANYAGIYVAGSTNTGTDGTGNVEVFHNTLYDCGARGESDAGAFGRGTDSPALFLSLKDNIAYAAGGEAYVSPSSSTTLMSGTNNLWFGGGVPPAFLSNNVTGDPRFSSVATRDFHLLPPSPAVNAGAATSIGTDFDGIARPQGAAFDIGAFELVP